MAPIVSIIIPVFNRPVLVAEAIESVLAQTNPNWELIVVDDGSTDHTWEVLESYAAKDERIRVFKRDREPKGAPTCRNIGINKALGDYLIIFDSDDLMAPWCLDDRITKIFKKPGRNFYVFPTAIFDGKNNKISKFSPNPNDDLLRNFLKHTDMFHTSSPTWKRDFIKKLNFDELLPCWQDCDLHIRALNSTNNYSVFFGLPDTFVRRNIKAGFRISDDIHSLSNASILLNYAYPKHLPNLSKKNRRLFKKFFLSNFANYIENSSDIIAFELLKIGLFAPFFSNSQKFALKSYTNSFLFFRKLPLPNLPFRFRFLFGISRKKNSKKKQFTDLDFDSLKKKMEKSDFKVLC